MYVEFPKCSRIIADNIYGYTLPNGEEQLFRINNNGNIENIGTGTGIFSNEYTANSMQYECINGTQWKTEFKPLYAFCAGCAVAIICYIVYKTMLERILGK